jgi:hypothetical protein
MFATADADFENPGRTGVQLRRPAMSMVLDDAQKPDIDVLPLAVARMAIAGDRVPHRHIVVEAMPRHPPSPLWTAQ